MARLKTESLPKFLTSKRNEILHLAEQRGASNVRVFGSVARGEHSPGSDVDFLVDFPPDTSIFTVIGLWRELSELLRRDVDLLTEGTLDEEWKVQVLKDAVQL